MTSLGSTTAASEAGPPPQPAELDALEADLDTIKVEIQQMRAGAESKQKLSEPRVANRQHDPTVRAEGSKIPTPSASPIEPEKPSDLYYRNRAERSFNQAGSPGLATPMVRQFAYQFAPPSPTTTQGDGTPAKYQDAVESPQAKAYSNNPSPHFAQPTQAANRRVNETLRRDTPPAKSSPEASPGKSTKARAPNFATDKRAAQRNQQRTSLPDSWMPAQEQGSPVENGVQKKEQHTPGSVTSVTPADPSSAGPSLRKKTSSYMTPTKSAQHRSIATLGEEKLNRMSPRVNAGSLRINAALANQCRPVAPEKAVLSRKSKLERHLSALKKAAELAAAPGFTLSSVDGHRSVSFRRVANTTPTSRDPDTDLMDPIEEMREIKEKLGREDLLRREPLQEPAPSAAPRGSRSNLLGPVLARNNREALSRTQPSRHSEEEPSFTGHLKARDSDNEPISQQTTGLRGQSSAEIAKALACGEHETASTSIASPVLLGDPAIKYHGPKPSRGDGVASDRKSEDLDMVFNLGLRKPDVHSTSSRKLSERTSLNAAACDFVPAGASDSLTLTKLSPWEPQFSGDTMHQQAPGPFDDGSGQNIGTCSMLDMAYPPEDSCPEERRIVPVSTNMSWQEQLAPAFMSYLPFGRNVDLIHGDFDTPTVSPTSDDTSPPLTAQQQRSSSVQWEISGRGRRGFHWTGGDGREISFTGMGPDAEHDPNSPVVYRNYRENTKTLHMHAARYPKIQTPGLLPPSAPKSMREYAEKMGLHRITCTNDPWTGKYDVITPAIVPLAGLCYPCKVDNNARHRVGGGIDTLDWN
jgi:hypothetical protein